MLKNILYACALSSIVTLTAFASEDVRDTINTTDNVIIIENEIAPENTLASDETEEAAPIILTEEKAAEEALVCEVKENVDENTLVSNEEEAPVVIKEEIVTPEALACGCKKKGKNNEELFSMNSEEQEQSKIACAKCGRNCNGKHLILAANDTEEENAVITTLPEEVQAA